MGGIYKRERSVGIKISETKYIQVTLTSLSLKQPLSHSQIDTLVTIIWANLGQAAHGGLQSWLWTPAITYTEGKKCMDLSSVVTVHHYPSVVSLL